MVHLQQVASMCLFLTFCLNISLIYRGHLVELHMMAMAFYKREGPGKDGIPAFGHVMVRPTSFLSY